MKKKITIENEKTFTDLINKTKYGENFSKIMGGTVEELDVKEVLYGNQYRTWIIIIAEDDKGILTKIVQRTELDYSFSSRLKGENKKVISFLFILLDDIEIIVYYDEINFTLNQFWTLKRIQNISGRSIYYEIRILEVIRNVAGHYCNNMI